MTAHASPLDRAQWLADNVLRPAAGSVDASAFIPPEHFATLAAEGMYGITSPGSVSGLELDLEAVSRVVEELASACLSTTFVLIQHLGLAGATLSDDAPEAVRGLASAAARGAVRGALALTASLPPTDAIHATRVEGGWTLAGEAPWITGWHYTTHVLVTTRAAGDRSLASVVPARTSASLSVKPVPLAAVNASATVRATFMDHFVPDTAVVGVRDTTDRSDDPRSLRLNGSLSLGLARQCAEILGPSSLDEEIDLHRERLDTAREWNEMASARAAASLLAVRAATRVMAAAGSRAALAGHVGERLLREAGFLVVFGSRPAIKANVLDQLHVG